MACDLNERWNNSKFFIVLNRKIQFLYTVIELTIGAYLADGDFNLS